MRLGAKTSRIELNLADPLREALQSRALADRGAGYEVAAQNLRESAVLAHNRLEEEEVRELIVVVTVLVLLGKVVDGGQLVGGPNEFVVRLFAGHA